jgi:hypothetical protein
VSAPQRIASTASRLATIAAELDAIRAELMAVRGGAIDGDAAHWLPALVDAVEHMRLDCADARHAARALREAMPGTGALQPRLL